MAYFSNGTEGADYQYRYCEHCAHDVNKNCPVWMLHLLWNGDDDSDKAMALEMLIPRDGIYNKQCVMYHKREE